MPLVNCVDCGKAISDAAPACPFCGRPSVKYRRWVRKHRLLRQPLARKGRSSSGNDDGHLGLAVESVGVRRAPGVLPPVLGRIRQETPGTGGPLLPPIRRGQ